MMFHYARIRGLRRGIVALPVAPARAEQPIRRPRHPIPYRIADPLIQSLQTEVVIRDDRAMRQFGMRRMTSRLPGRRAWPV